jgi:hypothetical protein
VTGVLPIHRGTTRGQKHVGERHDQEKGQDPRDDEHDP